MAGAPSGGDVPVTTEGTRRSFGRGGGRGRAGGGRSRTAGGGRDGERTLDVAPLIAAAEFPLELTDRI